MAQSLIDYKFYEAVTNFEKSEEAKEYYYKIMDTVVERNGVKDTVRNQILRVYAMLFCDDLGAEPGQIAGPDEVEATADRLYFGSMGLDHQHWYRMRHHFPVIDDDNYDRFAALVIADLNAGPLRQSTIESGEMLLVGEPDPLYMTREQRDGQQLRKVRLREIGK